MYLQFAQAITSAVLLLTLPTQAAFTRGICGAVSDNSFMPPHVACNVEGQLTDNKPLATIQVNGFEACRNLCLIGRKCLAFSYKPTDGNPSDSSTAGECSRYRIPLVKQHLQEGESGVFFWNRKCFEANYYDLKPLKNGDFMEPSLAPWLTVNNENILVTDGDAVDITTSCGGGACSDLDVPTFTSIRQWITLCEGVTYRISYNLGQLPGQTRLNGDPFIFSLIVTDPSLQDQTYMKFSDYTSNSFVDELDDPPQTYQAGAIVSKTFYLTPQSTGAYRLQFQGETSNGGSDHYMTMQISKVVVEAIPNPSHVD